MGIATDLTNQVFGRLIAISRHHKTHNGHWVWNCNCECGNPAIIYATNLVRWLTKSCGCFRIETSGLANLSHGHSVGEKPTSEYRSWCSLLSRCHNPNTRKFSDYGGRGISVCERWKNSFQNFIDDMGLKPSPKHSIDRIDVNGNYEPSNCRWATNAEQSRNRRNNKWYEYNGIKYVITDWATFFNIKEGTLREMLKYNSFEHAYNFYTKSKAS
jgi:hypothetical protein